MRKIMFQFVLLAILACFTGLPSIQASVSHVDPFPIGIFVAPEATSDKYQEVKDMNVTYILNNESGLEGNNASLEQCTAVGIKCMVHDTRLIMHPFTVGQTVADDERVLSNSNSLGQTITTTSDDFTAINTVELFIDKSDWTEESTVTLSIYNSTSKTTLLGSSSVTGPASQDYFVFNIYKWFSPNTTYYMELTSDGPTPLSVKWSSSDVYSGGTAYEAGIAQSNHDMWFKVNYNHKIYEGTPRPTTEMIDEIADLYKSNPALLGYFFVDEPSTKGMTGAQATMERFRQADPDHMTLANLLPNYASAEQLFRESYSGDFVSPAQSLGQTFKTNAVTTSISTIQLAGGTLWGSGETLTLKLWDSPARTTLLGEDTMGSSGTLNPKFSINAAVSPDTTYYWELTHNGEGVDNLVGWFLYGENGSDWEKDGSGYKNGIAMNSDFWFTINQDIAFRSYEDYVYRWANKRPDVLMFDYYPYGLGGGIYEDGYYDNLEIIRRQALAAKIDFWSFIQSVGMEGSLRQPNENELKYQVYTNLAYGAKGLNYFLYQNWEASGFVEGLILPDGSKSALYNSAKNINAGVLKLGPTLLGLKSEAVYHTGTRPQGTKAVPTDFFWQPADSSQPMIVSSFTNESGRKYVMVVNRDIQNSRMMAFSLPSKPGSVKEVSKVTGGETSTNYNSMAGTLSGSFAPGEGKLYVLDDETGDTNVTSLTTDVSSIYGNTSFKVTYGLESVTQNVYAQEIKFTYDPAILEFMSAASIKEGVGLLEIVKEPAGTIRLILASEGPGNAVTGQAPIVELTFRSKYVGQNTTSEISITSATLADSQGVEYDAALSSVNIQVTVDGIYGDFNHDNKVTIGDLAILAVNYGKDTSSSDWEQVKRADLNGDGKIDIEDLAALAKKIIE
ncbi:cohesin domain-containing protein [Paenibacillus eucommiae]|uniref:Dockerin domain-containing protein n=1 Tax=Paenibacillus eucommiae TaxID=1355755 RepID=A0ABS4IZJ4_9BACL|nr:cohesin domain-containing protein [Paenibacillus eucommiae]MBP1992261.1 hypothetical protein [Paenibacillus eucommiae]